MPPKFCHRNLGDTVFRNLSSNISMTNWLITDLTPFFRCRNLKLKKKKNLSAHSFRNISAFKSRMFEHAADRPVPRAPAPLPPQTITVFRATTVHCASVPVPLPPCIHAIAPLRPNAPCPGPRTPKYPWPTTLPPCTWPPSCHHGVPPPHPTVQTFFYFLKICHRFLTEIWWQHGPLMFPLIFSDNLPPFCHRNLVKIWHQLLFPKYFSDNLLPFCH